jgi:hypothetical protein
MVDQAPELHDRELNLRLTGRQYAGLKRLAADDDLPMAIVMRQMLNERLTAREAVTG